MPLTTSPWETTAKSPLGFFHFGDKFTNPFHQTFVIFHFWMTEIEEIFFAVNINFIVPDFCQ
jgi:hypothetical protein